MLIDVKVVHPLNASSLIVVTVGGKITVVSGLSSSCANNGPILSIPDKIP
jgi:hypothetical protein